MLEFNGATHEPDTRGSSGVERLGGTCALSRQRHKLVYKLITTEARYDKEILIASHLARLEQDRIAAA